MILTFFFLFDFYWGIFIDDLAYAFCVAESGSSGAVDAWVERPSFRRWPSRAEVVNATLARLRDAVIDIVTGSDDAFDEWK